MFLPLDKKEIKNIVTLQINNIRKMLLENGIELEVTDSAKDFIARVGYEPEFGARPIKRAIQNYILNDLSKKILAQEVDRQKPIIIDYANDNLIFRN